MVFIFITITISENNIQDQMFTINWIKVILIATPKTGTDTEAEIILFRAWRTSKNTIDRRNVAELQFH